MANIMRQWIIGISILHINYFVVEYSNPLKLFEIYKCEIQTIVYFIYNTWIQVIKFQNKDC